MLKRSDFIYVADCKLATEDNLSKIAACDGLFVSVMPRSWKEDKVFRERVRKGLISWTHLLSKPNNRKPESKRDHYYLADGHYVTSKGYRLLWILSTQKAAQDAETRQRNLEESIASLRELQTRISKGPVARCAPGSRFAHGALDPVLDQGSPLRFDALDPDNIRYPQQAAGYLD